MSRHHHHDKKSRVLLPARSRGYVITPWGRWILITPPDARRKYGFDEYIRYRCGPQGIESQRRWFPATRPPSYIGKWQYDGFFAAVQKATNAEYCCKHSSDGFGWNHRARIKHALREIESLKRLYEQRDELLRKLHESERPQFPLPQRKHPVRVLTPEEIAENDRRVAALKK